MDWKECITKRIAKSAQIDLELIKSLRETSQNKLTSSKILSLNDVTSASKLSLCYDSLRELLEALAISKGYKVYNHECYTGFIKEIIGNEGLADRFDRIRLLRNSINYYGQSISIEEARESIEEIEELISQIKKFLD